MPVNWNIPDYSLSQRGGQLDMATPVRNFFIAQDRKQKKLKDQKEAEREERMGKIIRSSRNPQTGKVDFGVARRKVLEDDKPGSFKDFQDFTKLHESDMKFEQNKMILAQERKNAFNNQMSSIADKVSRAQGDPTKQNFIIDSRLKPFLRANGENVERTPNNKLMQRLGNFVSEKESKRTFDLREKEQAKLLDKEFREKFIPSLDVSKLATDKNARNVLVQQIEGNPKYGGTKAAQNLIKNLKGSGSSLEDALAKMMITQQTQELKLTGQEQQGLGALEPAIKDMNTLVNLYKSGDTGGAGSSIASVMSGIPFFGQRAYPDAAAFSKHKIIMAERFLRAATGAAAPKEEKTEYAGYLPKWDDTPEQAQTAIETFMGHVEAKAAESISRLKILGTPKSLEKAAKMQSNINSMLSNVQRIKPKNKPDTYEFIGGDPNKEENWRLINE